MVHCLTTPAGALSDISLGDKFLPLNPHDMDTWNGLGLLDGGRNGIEQGGGFPVDVERGLSVKRCDCRVAETGFEQQVTEGLVVSTARFRRSPELDFDFLFGDRWQRKRIDRALQSGQKTPRLWNREREHLVWIVTGSTKAQDDDLPPAIRARPCGERVVRFDKPHSHLAAVANHGPVLPLLLLLFENHLVRIVATGDQLLPAPTGEQRRISNVDALIFVPPDRHPEPGLWPEAQRCRHLAG